MAAGGGRSIVVVFDLPWLVLWKQQWWQQLQGSRFRVEGSVRVLGFRVWGARVRDCWEELHFF